MGVSGQRLEEACGPDADIPAFSFLHFRASFGRYRSVFFGPSFHFDSVLANSLLRLDFTRDNCVRRLPLLWTDRLF